MENADKQKLNEALEKKNDRDKLTALTAKLMRESQKKRKNANRCCNKLLGKSKKLEIEANEIEGVSKRLQEKSDTLLREIEGLINEAIAGDKELEAWYKETIKAYKKDERTYTKIKFIVGGSKGLEALKCEISKKLKNRVGYLIVITIVQICIIAFAVCLLSSNETSKVLDYLYIPDVKRGICIMALLLLLLFMGFYGIHHITKSYLHYKNALHKIETLIMRLELFTDKDLITPYRLDRELELLYRILES